MIHVLRKLLNSEDGLSDTPLSERTPQWFANIYLRNTAKLRDARQRRIVFDSDDSDNKSDQDFHESPFVQLRQGRHRIPRRVTRAEILSLIARHRQWLIEDHGQSS